MAFVTVPKDLTVVKSKIAFNLTKRQLTCFGLGALVAVPSYLVLKEYIRNDIAMFLMIAIALPFFFMALFEKHGLPFEKVAMNILRVKFLTPSTRIYRTENFYRNLQTEIEQTEWGVKTIEKSKPASRKKKAQK